MSIDQTLTDEALQLSRTRRSLPDPPVRRYLRQHARLTQAEIATAVKRDRATVSRWESGARTPRGDDLLAYAELLDRIAAEMAQ
jgi:DNA-binding transcriptional regulator YiaG